MFKTLLSILLLLSFPFAKETFISQSQGTSTVFFDVHNNTNLNESADQDIPEEFTALREVTSEDSTISYDTARITTYAFFLGIPCETGFLESLSSMLINFYNSESKADIPMKKKVIKNSVLDADELAASKKLKKKDKINAYRALQIFSIVD